jgi:hypothetical protein
MRLYVSFPILMTVSDFREYCESVENFDSHAISEKTSSCRQARVERNFEEDPSHQIMAGSVELKRKPGPNHCRNKKSGHKSADPDHHVKHEKAAESEHSEVHPELDVDTAESNSASGSEAAGAASGICYCNSTVNTAEGTEEGQPASPQPQPDPGPEFSDYNPLRPEYVPYAEVSEGRQRIARRLHGEIVAFVSKNDADTEESRSSRNLIVDKVRRAAQSCWENCSVDVYGSCSTNLFLPHR